jgi:hypothetical protein
VTTHDQLFRAMAVNKKVRPAVEEILSYCSALVRFRVTDVGEASESVGCSSRSLPNSVTRAASEHFDDENQLFIHNLVSAKLLH